MHLIESKHDKFYCCTIKIIQTKPFSVVCVLEWLSGRVLDSRPKGRGLEPHRRHCVVTLSKNINPSFNSTGSTQEGPSLYN